MLTSFKSNQVSTNVGLSVKIVNDLRDDTHMTSMKIVKFLRTLTSLVHLRPNFFHLLDVGRPISNAQFSLTKKIKMGRPEHLLTLQPPPPTSSNISFTPKVVKYLYKTSNPNFWLGRKTIHVNWYYLYFKNFKCVPLIMGTMRVVGNSELTCTFEYLFRYSRRNFNEPFIHGIDSIEYI